MREKLEEIIFKAIFDAEYVLPKEAKYCAEVAADAIFFSPDLVVVEKWKLEQLISVAYEILEDVSQADILAKDLSQPLLDIKEGK